MNVIHENVLVEVPSPIKERNGIMLPEEEKPERKGTVIRHGEAVPSAVQLMLGKKPTVSYKEYYDGSEITIEGKRYIVMNYKDILIIE